MKKLYHVYVIIIFMLFVNNIHSQCLGIGGAYTPSITAASNVCSRTITVNVVAGNCPTSFFYYQLPSWISATYTNNGNNTYNIKFIFAKNISVTPRSYIMQLYSGSINIQQLGGVCDVDIETPYVEFEQVGGNKDINRINNVFNNCGYGGYNGTVFTFTNIPSWINITNNSNITETPIINCEPNNTGIPRYAVISYSNNTNYEKSIIVYQKSSTNSICKPTFSKQSLFFDGIGGADDIAVAFEGTNCNLNPFIFVNVPQWITITSAPDGSHIYISCNQGYNYSQDELNRYAEILCLIPSQNVIKRISIQQNYICCSLCSGNVGYPYIPSMENTGGVATYPVTYQNLDCSGGLIFTNVPDWVTLRNTYTYLPYSLTVTAQFLPNLSTVPGVEVLERSAIINYHIPNSAVSGTFVLIQNGCSIPWYNDSDGDGRGDIDSPIVANSCIIPYPGLVSNNLDYCPNIFAQTLNGCESGTNPLINWTSNINYDIFGSAVSSSKTYFDDLGKPIEYVAKDFVTNTVWGSETIYDSYGRKFRESFPAKTPTLNQTKFLSNSSNKITYLDKYYSNNNTLEPYQATATQPYSEVNYDKLNPGNVINVVGGNQINGSWKTGYSFTVPAAQEMYYVYGYNYFEGALVGTTEEIQTKFYKSVSIDANGVENVVFTDGEGKTLAAARSGTSNINPYEVYATISTQGYVDVHIPTGTAAGTFISPSTSADYTVYDLKTGLPITPTPATLPSGFAYRIVANTPPITDPKVMVTNVATGGILSTSAGALGIKYFVNYYDYAINIYDKTNRLTKSIQPNGFSTTYPTAATILKIVPAPAYLAAANFATSYTYNSLGQVIQVTNPDEGTSKFAYRKDGQIRYSQSAVQINSLSYTNYDDYARPIESGVKGSVLAGIWGFAYANPDGPLVHMSKSSVSEITGTIYDYTDNNLTSLLIPATLSLSSVLTTMGLTSTQISQNYTQKNLSSNVAVTYSATNGSVINALTWYSYDLYGRLEWMVQYNEGIGAKTIDYVYDYKGNVQEVVYQKLITSEKFVHKYTYDINNTVTKLETAQGNNAFAEEASYTYYLSGELKRTYLTKIGQGTDYTYTLGGMLKAINHPSLEQAKDPGGDANDAFGTTIDYYSGDYLRANTNIATAPNVSGANQDFNGNIKAITWANKTLDVVNPSAPVNATNKATKKSYLYNYNRNNWLSEATFGSISNSTWNLNMAITPAASYKEGSLTYDSNGNIKSLQRSNAAGATEDNLTYNYTVAGKNQLNSVADIIADGSFTADFDGQLAGNYVYNAIGRLTLNKKETTHYFYNTQGLVTEIKAGNILVSTAKTRVKFYYNERGQRIKKETYDVLGNLTNTMFYILDLSGNVMSNYSKPSLSPSITVQTEIPIYGLSRIGVYLKAVAPSPNFTNYQLTDHLGNVRVVLQKADNSTTVTTNSYADYYPFGEQLPNRKSFGGYRYAFQGQELDGETGMEAFQLRLWDGRIGRWLSPDPYGQYASPYLGMGNNPVGLVDPDGGYTRVGAWLRWIGGGFQGTLTGKSKTGAFGINYGQTSSLDSDGLGVTITTNIKWHDKSSSVSSSSSSWQYKDPFPNYKFNFLENRWSGYGIFGGELNSDFIGGVTGPIGEFYGWTSNPVAPGAPGAKIAFWMDQANNGKHAIDIAKKVFEAGAQAEGLISNYNGDHFSPTQPNSARYVHYGYGNSQVTILAKNKHASDSIMQVYKRSYSNVSSYLVNKY